MPLEMPENFDEDSAPECLGINEAIKRFENVMLSRIYIQQRFGDRIRYSIRIGMAILFLLVISIFILSLTLSSQMRLARESLVHMNNQFAMVSENMNDISLYMKNMEQQVAYLPKINNVTAEMDQQMSLMNRKLSVIQQEMGGVTGNIVQLQKKIQGIRGSMQQIDGQVNLLTYDVYRMSRPAESFNKFFPF